MSCPGSPTMNRPQMLHDGGVGARTPATTAGLVRRGGLVTLALAVVLLAVVGLSACSAASPRSTTAPGTATAAASPKTPSAATTTPTSAGTTPGTSPASGMPGNGGLGAKVVPAPSGFTLSEMPDVHNGPMTAADFNRYFGIAASDHFVRGYHVTYDGSDGSTTIEVALFEFATPAGAAAFKADFVSVSGGLIKSKADPVIPAADDFDASSADLGIYTRGVIATKGNRAFVITGTTNSADPVPVVQTMARQQYAAL
jgi:hypothetical protein